MTARPLTRQEAIPPTLEAPAEVRAAVAAYELARADQAEIEMACGILDDDSHEAWLVTERARLALEGLLCELALTSGRAWYRVDDSLWGLKQGRGSGFELARRSVPKGTGR